MALELYLDLISQPCRSVFIFAKKNNIPFVFKHIELFQVEQRGEEFGKINVLRKVPALRDGDFTLAESVAILIYMADKFGTPDHWYPADLQKRARVNEYLSWQHIAMKMNAAKVFWFKFLMPKALGMEVPKEKLDSAVEDMEASLKMLEEKFLQDKPFIAGEQISLADLAAIVELMEVVGAGMDVFLGRVKLAAWRDRVEAAIGKDLFHEAHQVILSLSKTMQPMGHIELQYFKSRAIKMLL